MINGNRLVLCVTAFVLGASPLFSQENIVQKKSEKPWPSRVLITNDDGIDDPKIKALALAFAQVAETYVIAPLQDCSGTAHHITAYSKRALRVEQRSMGEAIRAYGVDGFPADCVLLALKGIMKDSPPDLVISGINDGPNLGFDWLASGTIGAARIAAYWGVPAIAVSGVRESIPGSLEAVAKWSVKLAQSDLVRQLGPKQYLTVSFPRVAPAEIKEVRVAGRAGILLEFSFARAAQDPALPEKQVWQMLPPKRNENVSAESDVGLYSAGFIVVVPMRADEDDAEMISRLKKEASSLPGWR